jgi:hypothetical protein
MRVVSTLADHGLQANIFVPLCELFHARVPPGNPKGDMGRAAAGRERFAVEAPRNDQSACWEMSMDRKSSVLVMVTLVAVTLVATGRGDDASVTIPDQMSRDRAASAPVVLAQGRCFNGRCF